LVNSGADSVKLPCSELAAVLVSRARCGCMLAWRNAMHLAIVPLAVLLIATSSTPDETGAGGRLELVVGGEIDNTVESAQAKVINAFGMGFDSAGSLYFVEMLGHRVRKIGMDGILKTLAGTGRAGNGGDGGPAIRSELNGPHSLAAAGGDIFIADTWN